MTKPVLLCADGSTFSTNALAAGIRLLGEKRDYVLINVVEGPDVSRFVATGLSGGVMSPAEIDYQLSQGRDAGEALLGDVAMRLGMVDHPRRLVEGAAGEEICRLAEEFDADAIVVGSRGHGGLLRAVLGSVSDHVVRHAPCTVVVARDDALT